MVNQEKIKYWNPFLKFCSYLPINNYNSTGKPISSNTMGPKTIRSIFSWAFITRLWYWKIFIIKLKKLLLSNFIGVVKTDVVRLIPKMSHLSHWRMKFQDESISTYHTLSCFTDSITMMRWWLIWEISSLGPVFEHLVSIICRFNWIFETAAILVFYFWFSRIFFIGKLHICFYVQFLAFMMCWILFV